jgi:hypothetical protein
MASVWAFLIALGWGISNAFWTGAACYAFAALSVVFVPGKGAKQ